MTKFTTQRMLFLFFFFCFLFRISFSHPMRNRDDICSYFDKDTNMEASEIKVNQTSDFLIMDKCRHNYYFQPSLGLVGKKIKLEITFLNRSQSAYGDPFLVSQTKRIPEISATESNNLNYDYSNQDLTGFSSMRMKRVITQYVENSDDIMYKQFFDNFRYFSIYKDLFLLPQDYDPTPITYQYKVSVIEKNDCDYPCAANGKCVMGKCICQDSFFDVDCSKALRVISSDDSFDLTLNASDYDFFAISIMTDNYVRIDVTFETNSTKSYMLSSYKLEDDRSLPNGLTKSYKQIPSKKIVLEWTHDYNEYITYLIIGLWNGDYKTTNIKISIKESGRPLIDTIVRYCFLIIIGFGVLMLISVFLGCIFEILCNILRAIIHLLPNPSDLSRRDIEKYFPKKQFRDLVNEYNQPNCAICLNDYTPVDLCRIMIPCKHIFHSQCIDSWLNSKMKCPTCNKIFDKREVRRILKEEKAKKIKANSTTKLQGNILPMTDEDSKRQENKALVDSDKLAIDNESL